MGFSRQEYWSGLSVPSPGIELRSPALQADSLPSEPLGKPYYQQAFCKCKSLSPGETKPAIQKPLDISYSLTASWETYMQERKQQLERDMEQQTGSK